MRRPSLVLCVVVAAPPVLNAADNTEYRTPETAITAKVGPAAAPPTAGPAPFLGIHVQPDAMGRLVVDDVQPDSPADEAGLHPGDVLTRLDGKEVGSVDAFKAVLRARSPGNSLKVAASRAGRPIEATATLTAISKPMPAGRAPVSTPLGIQVVAAKEGDGVTIEQVVPGSIADKAKLKVGETILKIDDTTLTGPEKIREALSAKKPDDALTLTLLLAEKKVEMKLKLEPEGAPGRRVGGPTGGGWNRGPRYWTRPTYRLAIILVEYPDVKHNKDIAPEAWEKAMFGRDGTYKKTATGQDAHGTMYDYYLEQSYGNLKIEGKAFPYVQVQKKREEYGTANGNRTELLTEALDKLLARDGKDALKDFDGVFYIYAGGRMTVPRGSLYWPHRASVSHNGKSWPYFICPEGGQRMANISVFCHEFGHMLGLPDLYARPENPGSEGLDMWCAMSNQAGNGRPQHFSAWCKEKLGWVKPAVIDPTVRQKIALAPIESSPRECVKVLARPDGSEYFLLEYRAKKGFDASLPAEGLLIWRVVGNRPILEEAHGVEGPAGPRVFRDFVPYPNDANQSFTPFTTPSSRSQLGGGLPVWITNIEKRPDGKIGFHIGYEYQ
jgi:M6 family metalloprotease-like protein